MVPRCSTFTLLSAITFVCLAVLMGTPGAGTGQLYQYTNACIDCHDMPPLDAAYRNITTGGFTGSHSTHNPAAVAPQSACQKCHSGAASYTTSHMDGYVNMTTNLNNSAAPAMYNKPRFFNRTSNPALTTCANVNCHFENTTPVWGTAPITSPSGCGTCHGAPPADGNHPVAGQKHGTYFGTDTSACVKCHVDHTADPYPFSHATSAGKRSLILGFTTSPNAGGSYSQSVNLSYPNFLPSQNPARNGNCTNLYCHSNGNGGPANQTPQWGGSLRADCSGCHGGNATAFLHITSGKHAKHTNNAAFLGSNLECARCHNATVSAGNDRAITNLSNHVNGTKNIVFAQGGSYSGGTCSATLCHSAGKASAPQPAAPSWSSAGSLDCTGCHGAGGNYGEPSYTNAGVAADLANSHTAKHVKGNFSCTNCHNSTATSWGSLKPGGSHLSGSVDVVFSPTYDRGGASYNGTIGTKSCSNIYCHSNGNGGNPNLTPQWGLTLPSDCTACHGNDATAGITISSGRHRAHLNNYTTFGRGNNFGCVDCHAKTVSDNRTIANAANHVNTIKDYSGARSGRIATPGTGACNNNYCHSTGQNSSAFAYWNMTGANWYSGRTLSCTGCHGNAAVPDFPPYLGAPNYVSGGPWTSTANSHQQHVVGNGLTSTTGCANCHYRTVDSAIPNKLRDYSTLHLNRSRDIAFSVAASQSGVQGRYSSTTQQCLNTYCHGVAASVQWGSTSLTCGSCHSGEYNGFNGNNAGAHKMHYQVTSTPASGTYATMTPGQGSGATAASYQFNCTSCHSSPAVHANGEGVPGTAAAQIYFGYSTAGRRGTYSYGTNQGTDNGFKWTNGGNCATTYCHSNGNGGNGASTSFTWATPAGTLGCTGCHGNATTNTLSGKHQKHVNNDSFFGTNNSFGCVQCHAKTVSNNTTIANKLNHVNKFKDFSGALAYGPSHYNGSAKQCSSIYCHSNGNTTSISYQDPPTWTSGSTLSCNGCHGTTNPTTGAPDYTNGGAGSSTPNSHPKHVARLSITDTTGCARCHYRTVEAATAGKLRNYSTLHLNGTRDVSMKLFGGATGTFDGVSCSNTYCHGPGPSIAWGSTSQCNSCHGASYTSFSSASRKGAHARHIQTDTLPTAYASTGVGNQSSDPTKYQFGCASCHNPSVAAHINAVPNSGGGVAEIYFGYSSLGRKGTYNPGMVQSGSDNGFLWTNGGNCATTYCHSNGNGGNGANTTFTWATAAGTLACIGCHGNDVASGTVIATNKHRNHLDPSYNISLGAGNGYGCANCHSRTVSDNRTIKDKSKHVNKFKDFSSNRGGSTYSNYICSNIYCHSNGNPAAQVFVAMTTSKAWNGSATLGCNGCHGRNNAATGAPDYANGGLGSTTPNNHATHVANLYISDTTKCSICHYKTASKTVANRYKDYTGVFYHINNKRDVIFDPARTLFGSSTWTQSGNSGSCTVYCHSNVQGSNGIAGPSSYGNPTWGDNFAGACNRCHLDMKTDPVGTGSHWPHVNASTANLACSTCHNGAGDGTTRHTNGVINLSFSGSAAGTGYSLFSSIAPGSGYGTCSAIPCHGGNSAVWGTRIQCLDCHSTSINGRAAIRPFFNSTTSKSHHIQGIPVSQMNTVCFQCHWEAKGNAAGTAGTGFINYSFHAKGSTYSGQAVQLVIYGSGVRPTTRTANVTYVAYTANGATSRRRTEVKKINLVCRGCHRSANDTAQPFGDGKTPKQYSWDGYSIFSRYSSGYSNTGNDVTAWGKYNVNNTNNKATANKAYSAHGNAKNNMRGWDTTNGTDSPTYSAPATDNVYCFDCHNSHGTAATGVMSSYSSATGRYSGAILKSTVNGKGGFSATYTPAQAGSTGTHDLTNPGADLCFDCHSNQTSNSSYPWGYNDTFGIAAGKSIFGYWDSTRFTGSGAGTFPPATRYGYKAGTSNAKNANMGGHLGASSALTTTVSQRTFPSGMKDVVPTSGSVIQGLCTPCHDPHGVSPSLGASKQYGVPLLKGTWITSPYQEDAAPATPADNRGGSTDNRSGQQGPLVAGGTPGYHIDQNTLGATTTSGSAPRKTDYPALSGATALQTNSVANFAGLCTGCHSQSAIANGTSTPATASNWKTVGRIHQSVNGWAATTGTGGNVNNAKHAYLCSKCHTPHNYRLPRLLVTNCLDGKHQGRVTSGGNPGQTTGSGSSGQGLGRFPGGGGGSTSGNASSAWGPGAWFFGTAGSGGAAGSTQTCHDTPTAGGTFNGYTTEKWNTKSQW